MTSPARRSDAWFESLYARHDDPWAFATSEYEARKYALTVASLPRVRYRRAFEPGCAQGILTEQLAPRCDALLATDVVASVVARARLRLRAHAHVQVERLAVPDAWPSGSFDLVVLSEILYYLAPDTLETLLARADASVEGGGHLVEVHWTGETDYPLSAARVHAALDGRAGWRRLVLHLDERFRLSVFERAS